MNNQSHLLSVPVSHSNVSSHFPPPLPLPGNSLAVARQRPSRLPLPLFSTTYYTSPLDLSRAYSSPHLFFPSLPYGFYPPPSLLPLPAIPRCHLMPGTCCAMKCRDPLLLHTPPRRCVGHSCQRLASSNYLSRSFYYGDPLLNHDVSRKSKVDNGSQDVPAARDPLPLDLSAKSQGDNCAKSPNFTTPFLLQ